jgi:hypothetical protein
MEPTQILSIYKAARAKISDEKNWTQNAYARNTQGDIVSYSSSEAVCFCALGALKSIRSLEFDDIQLLEEECNYSIEEFNDTHTHAEILAAFDRAIVKLESKLEFKVNLPAVG